MKQVGEKHKVPIHDVYNKEITSYVPNAYNLNHYILEQYAVTIS